MKTSKLIISIGIALIIIFVIASCKEKNNDSKKSEQVSQSLSKDELENEAWKMEEKYWDYVQQNDTVSYKTLWHNDFIGYPTFGDGVSNKSKIAIWIPELHQDPNLKFSNKLYKKAVNAIDDVVIVFYDGELIWTDNENKVVRKVTKKFTHTWKKYGDNWLILGGMAADKNQDVLKN